MNIPPNHVVKQAKKNVLQLGNGGIDPPPISPQEAFSRMELSLGVQLDFIALIDLHRTRAL